MAVFFSETRRQSGLPRRPLNAPPKKHVTLFSGDDGRRPPHGAQCLPFAAASPPPEPAASAVAALGSLLRRPSTSKPQLSPAVLPRYPAVTDSRSPSPSTVGVRRPPTIGRRRPGSCAFRRPSPPRMPRLSPAASTHRRSRRLPRPSPAAVRSRRLHPPWPPPQSTAGAAVCHGRLHLPREPPSATAVSMRRGRRPPLHIRHGRLHPPRPQPAARRESPPPSSAAVVRCLHPPREPSSATAASIRRGRLAASITRRG